MNQLKEQMESNQAENKAVQIRVDERLDQMQSSINSLTTKIEELMKQGTNVTPSSSSTMPMDPRSKGLLLTPSIQASPLSNVVDLREIRENNNYNQVFFKPSKVYLPRFVRDDVKGWIQLCYLSFMFNSIPDDKRVMYVAMHFDGWARSWFLAEFKSIEGVNWEYFREALVARFSNEGHENVVAGLS